MDPKLILNGIFLKNTIITHLKEELSTLKELSPYDAYISCDLKEADSSFVGTLSVTSAIGTFCSSFKNKNMTVLADRLFKDLKKKITTWNTNRSYFY